MKKQLTDFYPDQADVIEADIEKLAYCVLVCLSNRDSKNFLNFFNLVGEFCRQFGGHIDKNSELGRKVAQAISFLVSKGMLFKDPAQYNSECYCISPESKSLMEKGIFEGWIRHHRYSAELLHPLLREEVWALFKIDSLQEAVAIMFRIVEVEVRDSANCEDELVGAKLIRGAFSDKNKNFVFDRESVTKSEKEGLAHIFAGSFLFFRNAAAHREVPYSKDEAFEVLMLGSLLLRLTYRSFSLQNGRA